MARKNTIESDSDNDSETAHAATPARSVDTSPGSPTAMNVEVKSGSPTKGSMSSATKQDVAASNDSRGPNTNANTNANGEKKTDSKTPAGPSPGKTTIRMQINRKPEFVKNGAQDTRKESRNMNKDNDNKDNEDNDEMDVDIESVDPAPIALKESPQERPASALRTGRGKRVLEDDSSDDNTNSNSNNEEVEEVDDEIVDSKKPKTTFRKMGDISSRKTQPSEDDVSSVSSVSKSTSSPEKTTSIPEPKKSNKSTNDTSAKIEHQKRVKREAEEERQRLSALLAADYTQMTPREATSHRSNMLTTLHKCYERISSQVAKVDVLIAEYDRRNNARNITQAMHDNVCRTVGTKRAQFKEAVDTYKKLYSHIQKFDQTFENNILFN